LVGFFKAHIDYFIFEFAKEDFFYRTLFRYFRILKYLKKNRIDYINNKKIAKNEAIKKLFFSHPHDLAKKKWYYCLGAYEACLQPIIIHHPLIQKTGRKKDQLRLGKIFISFFFILFQIG
jgi:hypothetical protein